MPLINPVRSRKARGFAIIIALSLMAFVLLLLVSMTTLVRVDSATSSSSRSTLQARQNALLGAQVAIGNLQKYAGPDQRVTATGDVLLTTDPSKAKYTGVWDSDPTSPTYGQPLDWLVSRTAGSTFDPLNYTSTASTATWPKLVDTVRVGQPDEIEAIHAEPIQIFDDNGSAIGSYAYWIGDEGVKARINIPDRLSDVADSDGFTMSDALSRFYSAQSVGIRYMDTTRLAGYDPKAAWVSKLYGLDALDLQTGNVGLGNDLLHSTTAYSTSILSNTRDGGLKKDLTHIFENDASFNREFDNTGGRNDWKEDFIFRPSGATEGWNGTSFNAVGAPNWGILRDYYLSYKNVNAGSYTTTQFDNLASNGDGIAPWKNAYENDTAESYQSNSPVHAIIGMLQLGVGLEYVRTNTARDGSPSLDDVYYPRIHLRPIVGLYNPYDVAINAEDYFVEWSFEPIITLTVGSTTVELKPSDLIPSNATSGTHFRWRFNNFDFLPGETRLFALDDRHNLLSNSFDPSMSNDYSEQGSYYINLTRDTNVAASLTDANKNALEFLDDGSAVPQVAIKVEFYKQGTSTSGLIWNKIGSSIDTDTYQLWQSPFSSNATPSSFDGPFDQTFTNLKTQLTANSSGELTTPTIASFRMGLRGSKTNLEPFRFLVDGTPRAMDNGASVDGFGSGKGLAYTGHFTGEAELGSLEPQSTLSSRYTSPWGQDRGGSSAANVTLFHLPRAPLLSLGYLQHANLSKHSFEPTYMAANSYAPFRIPLNDTKAFIDNRLFFDFSHEINARIWDSFYFSSIPQDLTSVELGEYLGGSSNLANSRYRLYEPQGFPAVTEALLVDPSVAETPQLVSSRLIVEGGFNINSTSVDAWKAVFSSMNGLGVPVYDPGTGQLSSINTVQDKPFLSRTGAPAGRSFWNGYREFTDTEVTAFATEMVNEIKQRGPFLSLADFVNRNPQSSNPDEQKRSALQSALDKSLNVDTIVDNDASDGIFADNIGLAAQAVPGYSNTNNTEDRQGMGFPGWVLQGDLLQHLGAILTARSDTFIIRSYGAVTNPINGEIAEAWLEAVVQRFPEPVIETGYAGTNLELINADNVLGRQFRIISMRWLSKEEI